MKNKILLSISFVLLFMFILIGIYQNQNSTKKTLSKIAGADCGPCLTIPFYECGYDGGMGSCVWEDGGCGGGSCGVDCPSTSNHQGCSGYFGSCTMGTVNCAERVKPKCVINLEPGGCRCMNDIGTSLGTYCVRADC